MKTSDPRRVESTVLDQYGAELKDLALGSAHGRRCGSPSRRRSSRTSRPRPWSRPSKTIRNRVDKWGVAEPDIKRKSNNQIRSSSPGSRIRRRRRSSSAGRRSSSSRSPTTSRRCSTRSAEKLPACPLDQGLLRAPLPEGGCWSLEGVELPSGEGRQVTFIAANNRSQLDAAIDKYGKPKLQPGQEIGVGEGTLGAGVVKTRYYRTYLLHAKTELTGDYISDARVGTDNSQGAGKPVVIFTMTPEGGRLRRGSPRPTSAAAWPPCSTQGGDRALHPGQDLRPTARSRWAQRGPPSR